MDEKLNHLEEKIEAVVPDNYFSISRTATYGYIAALPLFVMYEVLMILVNFHQPFQIRIAADVWIKRLLGDFGLGGHLALIVVVLAIGVAVYMVDRKRKIPFRKDYLGWMIAESLLYAIVLAVVIGQALSLIFNMALTDGLPIMAPKREPGITAQLALSLGAGLYEELVFRVLLVGGLYALLNMFLKRDVYAYVIAAVIGAALFSLVHFTGIYGDPFTLYSFVFRFVFGLAFNALFLVRGFGVVAWSHALYDVLVVTIWRT